MADRELNIQVNLTGGKKAEEGLEKLENAGNAVGETFSGMTDAVKATGGEFSEQLGAIGESASNLGGSFIELGESVGGSFTAMMGPLAAVIVGIIELSKANQEYEASASGATLKAQAYMASVAEMTSLVEGLADAEVELTYIQLQRLSKLALASQQPVEEAQLIRESNETLVEKIDVIDKYIKKMKALERRQARGNVLHKQDALALSVYLEKFPQFIKAEKSRTMLLARREQIQAQLNLREEKALVLQQEASYHRRELERERKRLEKTSPKFQRELRAKETDIIKESILARQEAEKNSLKTQHMAAVFASEKKIREINALEDVSQKVKATAVEAETVRLNAQLLQIEKSHQEKLKAERDKARQQRRMRLLRDEAIRRKSLAETFQIRLLEIEQMKLQGATAEEVAKHRYDAELKLADNNASQRLMIDLRYENQRLAIQAEADAKAEEERKRQEEHRRNFILESQEFDISMMEQMRERKFSEELSTHLGLSAIIDQGTAQELAALEFKYQREIEMKERSEEEITELTRRYNLERQAIQEGAINAQIDSVANMTNKLGAGFMQAGYASLFFGESFKDSAAEVIKGLGEQAAVEALMNTAKGLAAAVLNPAAAGGYFAAAGVFGAAATAAGLASSALGGGGGGGGGGASAVSPTGSPQTAPTPEREQAESSSMVFNINFGGAVIYDSKSAAEQAMADRITRLQNTQRRGAPRRRS
jgi:hypothetical protein